MSFLNVEIKARCKDPGFIHNYLLQQKASFRGTDYQTDTYFNVPNGRLKLRQGNIENNLIFYERDNQPGPKRSHFHLVNVPDAQALKEILTKSSGLKIIVEKKRSIYFIENIRFHIDEVLRLGHFVEIEASNKYADLPDEKLQMQCDYYMKEFRIEEDDLISVSYSDMLLDKSAAH
jgi:adenylate cyclase, class 2